jgi:hypothetical protein
MKRSLAMLVVGASALGAALAHASPPTPPFVRLVYVPGLATEVCPSAAFFEDEVSARLGHYAFSEVADMLLVVAIERGQSSGFHGRFFVRSAGVVTGERRMQLGSCRELVRSLAAAVSVLLAGGEDPLGAPAPGAPSLVNAKLVASAPAERPEVAPAPLQPDRASAAAVASAAPAYGAGPGGAAWHLGAGSSLRFHTIQRLVEQERAPTLGFRLSGGLGWRRFGLDLALQGELPRRRSLGRGHVSAFNLELAILPCWRWWLQVCGSLGAGMISASATGYDDNRTLVKPTLSAGLRVARAFGQGRWRLQPFVALDQALLRWRFDVDDRAVWQQGATSGSLGLELLTVFP